MKFLFFRQRFRLKPAIVYGMLTLFISHYHSVSGQEVKVNGGFITDSLKVGGETAFYLSARYPSSINVLFPDSTYSFSPFEFQKKKYFATETQSGSSVDSAVYYLTTFEVDRTLFLDLPVFVINEQDCTAYHTERDSILVEQMVNQIPDSLNAADLPLKMNTAYQRVFFGFNYLVWGIVLSALVVTLALGWFLFGKKIKRYYRTRRLQRNHQKFMDAYVSSVNQLRSAFSTVKAESSLSLWKKYMEQLESKPYTKLTTREMMAMQKDAALEKNLRAIDSAIYGHQSMVIDPFENLKEYAHRHFQEKIEEVKHG
ncbi:MAG: hypothetical protein ACOYXT_25535 [Bacteroidota bacterium]